MIMDSSLIQPQDHLINDCGLKKFQPQDVPSGEGVRNGVGGAYHKKVQPGPHQNKTKTLLDQTNKKITLKAIYLIQDKRTTGYIIAYIEPQGLVHRSRLNILQTKLMVMTMVI